MALRGCGVSKFLYQPSLLRKMLNTDNSIGQKRFFSPFGISDGVFRAVRWAAGYRPRRALARIYKQISTTSPSNGAAAHAPARVWTHVCTHARAHVCTHGSKFPYQPSLRRISSCSTSRSIFSNSSAHADLFLATQRGRCPRHRPRPLSITPIDLVR